MGIKRETEASFQAAVIALAKLYGWTAHHHYDSRRSQGGFPDLVLVRGPRYRSRVVFAELKLAGKKPRQDQAFFLDALASITDQVFVWAPDSWPEIKAALMSA